MAKSKDKIVFIVGPTAVGKSSVAHSLAKKLKGEVVSLDSMQVYKEISVASDKPSKDMFKEVPYHLVGIVSVKDEFNVSLFKTLAQESIVDVLRRKKLPIFAGGSGLYLQVLLDGIFDGASRDLGLRQALEKEAKEKGNTCLYEKLKNIDPASAEKIHPNNLIRVIRALEVSLLGGKPFSEKKEEREGIWGKYDIRVFGLDMEREDLYERINRRVDEMFVRGLAEEIKGITSLPLSLTASAMIGVKEILESFKGEYDLDRAKELIKRNTRHYAKRQLTWFRKD
ncbi:MAG: tRNA (adenosine(37)-N6)-dimethylallyltransferase MiaA, partial [Candidatus Omnitrophica bacterium]|nr:tRNA (adenosine(37)-N6)-dimethylallyltransferase MiaA [Candidatus Omnitrophota bacterium]